MFSELTKYHQHIPVTPPTSISDLPANLRIYSDNLLEVWFTPNPVPTHIPELWILGITPGWQQMKIAYQGAAAALGEGLTTTQAVARPKPQVAFAGSMRANLVKMLDQLGLPTLLNTTSVVDLFGTTRLRTGSVMRCPVFRYSPHSKNYTGHSPKPLTHPVLKQMIDELFAEELANTPNCLILPLGKAVEGVLDYCSDLGLVDSQRILRGLPHPSGANAHAPRQFAQRKIELSASLQSWFASQQQLRDLP